MNHHRKFLVLATFLLTLLPFGTNASTLAWFGNSFSVAENAYLQVPIMVNCHTCGVNETMTLTDTNSMIPSCMLTCQEQSGALDDIDRGHWNYVVAQDNICNFIVWDIFYYNGSANVTASANQLTNWSTHAKSAGGKLVIEEMWLRVGTTEETQQWQDIADRWYDSVARASGAILSPNGHAWFTAHQKNPKLEFIDPSWNDAMHPGKFGAYLNVCCFFAALTGISPVGHTNHAIGDAFALPDSEALFAQQEAWNAYQYFKVVTPIGGKTHPVPADFSPDHFTCKLQRGSLIVAGRNIRDARLLDLDGRQLETRAPVIENNRAVMNAPAASGLYIVQALADDGWETIRFEAGAR